MRYLYALPDWLRNYRRDWLAGDIGAGLIVTVMLIPQSLAYALIAGLPPEVGLYASMLPLLAYAWFGSSMTLAVGPVAVVSLMTASALAPLAAPGSAEYIALAVMLALLSGLMLLAFGLLRFGFLAHLLSHPVISGFISGSALLIAVGQLKHLLGLKASAQGLPAILAELLPQLPRTNTVTLSIGLAAIAFLVFARARLSPLLRRVGVSARVADIAARMAPMLVVIVSTLVVGALALDARAGVSVVGAVPRGLPRLHLPPLSLEVVARLWLPALLIALVGFVESVSVAQSLALLRRQRVQPDRELLGLGAANIASALSGGYPVTGGFARSVVNFAAGANTPLAGVVSALLMALVVALFVHAFHHLPQAVLAATIVVAVMALVDLDTLKTAWRYDRADAVALLATAAGVLLLGVEAGIVLGVVLSLAALLWRAGVPHVARVGRVPGTEHFRNELRHPVETLPGLVALRIDESLFFGNADAIEDAIARAIGEQEGTRRVLLILSAVNRIDTTALDMLARLERALGESGVELCLAEVKGPVMDRLARTAFAERLAGRIFLSTHEAFCRHECVPVVPRAGREG